MTEETEQLQGTADDLDERMEAYRQESEAPQQEDEPEAQPEGEGEAGDPSGEPEEAKEPDELEKLRKSIRERSAAVRKEKLARTALEREMEELRQQVASLKKEPDPLADLKDDDSDPISDLEILKRAARQMNKAEAPSPSDQQANHVQKLSGWAGEFEVEFRSEHPDYDDAAQHVAQTRVAELTAMLNDPIKAQETFKNELIGMMAQCYKEGRDPAETVYNIAKARGFSGGTTAAVSNNGQTAQQTTPEVDKTAQKLQTIKRGQEASRSMGAGGKSEAGKLTIDSINAMTDPDARYKAYEKLRDAELRRESGAA